MMLLVATNFQPLPASTVSISVTDTASAGVEIRTEDQPSLQQKWYLIQNMDIDNTAFVEIGDSSVAATVPGVSPGSMALGPLTAMVVNGSYGRYVSAICGSTLTATLYVTPGHI